MVELQSGKDITSVNVADPIGRRDPRRLRIRDSTSVADGSAFEWAISLLSLTWITAPSRLHGRCGASFAGVWCAASEVAEARNRKGPSIVLETGFG
jgi:hypothetical protein